MGDYEIVEFKDREPERTPTPEPVFTPEPVVIASVVEVRASDQLP